MTYVELRQKQNISPEMSKQYQQIAVIICWKLELCTFVRTGFFWRKKSRLRKLQPKKWARVKRNENCFFFQSLRNDDPFSKGLVFLKWLGAAKKVLRGIGNSERICRSLSSCEIKRMLLYPTVSTPGWNRACLYKPWQAGVQKRVPSGRVSKNSQTGRRGRIVFQNLQY